jgi:hypothetical protein
MMMGDVLLYSFAKAAPLRKFQITAESPGLLHWTTESCIHIMTLFCSC